MRRADIALPSSTRARVAGSRHTAAAERLASRALTAPSLPAPLAPRQHNGGQQSGSFHRFSIELRRPTIVVPRSSKTDVAGGDPEFMIAACNGGLLVSNEFYMRAAKEGEEKKCWMSRIHVAASDLQLSTGGIEPDGVRCAVPGASALLPMVDGEGGSSVDTAFFVDQPLRPLSGGNVLKDASTF